MTHARTKVRATVKIGSSHFLTVDPGFSPRHGQARIASIFLNSHIIYALTKAE